MSQRALFALFRDVSTVAGVVGRLHDLGISDDDIVIMSNIPYTPKMLGLSSKPGKIGGFALIGAVLGVATAIFLTAGIFLLYPLIQGGQPLIPIPPSIIVTFEVTMLGTMWATFLGLLVINRFPVFGRPAYDVRVSEGEIGVVVQGEFHSERASEVDQSRK